MRHQLIWRSAGGLLMILTLAALSLAAQAAGPLPPLAAAAPQDTPFPTPACGPAWRQISSPNVGTDSNYLQDVTVINANDVWAVGGTAGLYAPLTLHWDGSQWSTVPFTTPGTDFLWGVDGLTANDVWAVGEGGIAAHWDGNSWTGGSIINGTLFGVTMIAPNDVWAVGYSAPNTLIMHWNGSTWAVVPSPNPAGALASILHRLAAVSPTDIWAVGYYADSTSRYPLAEHWNGTAWSIVPISGIMVGNLDLYDVAAVASNDVWVVGAYDNPPPGLILHWDGSQWSVVPHPGPDVEGITALAANDIWAVGWYEIEHWNGSTWSLVPTPNGPLSAVDASAPDNMWAVGFVLGLGYPDETLTEHYSDPCPPPNPCLIQFTDVDATNPFYPYIRCLACRGIVSGYSDGTFRWGNNVTRGQTAKIVSNAASINDAVPPNQRTFTDIVPANSPFWLWIERLAGRGIISGYSCGGPDEPCFPPWNRPYFRPGADVTRGQLAKIVAQAAGYPDPIPTTQQTFADVPPTQPFWLWVERVYAHGVINGYACGGPGEPCDPQQRPYFRPGAPATRGQSAKITAQAFFPNCSTPRRK